MAKTSKGESFVPKYLKNVDSRTYRAFYKWGSEDKFYFPSDRSRIYEFMRDALGLTDAYFAEGDYANVAVNTEAIGTGLDNKDIDKLRLIVGEENVDIDYDSRIRASITKVGEELKAMHDLHLPPIVDAVITPQDSREIEEVLAYAKKRKLTVVVKSSLVPKVSGKKTIALDLSKKFNRIIEFSEVDSYVVVESGMLLPILEDIMNNAPDNFKDYNIASRFTVGHFPLEFEECTLFDAVNGYKYGMESSYYGTFDKIVEEVEYMTADGVVSSPVEGAIPTKIKLRLRKYYPHNKYGFAYMFKTYQEAVNAMRDIYSKGGAVPVEIRLSDAKETSLLMRYYMLDDSPLDGWLKMFKTVDGERCMLVGFSGGPYTYSRLAYNQVKSACRKYKAVSMTSFVADAYEDSRYVEMYARESLEDFNLHTKSEYYELSWSEIPDKTKELSCGNGFVRSRIIAPNIDGAILEVVTISE